MQNDAALSVLSRDELEQLVSIYAKNWLAMDGYWFQAVERKRGMDEAMEHDVARLARVHAHRGAAHQGAAQAAGTGRA